MLCELIGLDLFKKVINFCGPLMVAKTFQSLEKIYILSETRVHLQRHSNTKPTAFPSSIQVIESDD